jgi:cellulose synthase/poly-beta-1,6-N-acetylglucosamine synthase-like glycosyltransferase
MDSVYTVVFYTFAFISVYAQVFFLLTFLQKRRQIVYTSEDFVLENYPTVTVIVPCYNEEKTIEKTVKSLLSLDYQKDRLTLFLVDDGSKDNTWKLLQQYKDHPNIRIFNKENGGKHTALNLGLDNLESEFVGCLDADSFVHPQALKRIIKTFQDNPKNMAVAPSILVYNPENVIQTVQKIEYEMANYVKKMLGFNGGINVTPGPFSIFRKKVFDELGHYRKAHNTEDQEIGLRMQEHWYKIDACIDAYVYTNSPNSIVKLYRQRLRWVYGFIKNLVDYRRLLFRKKYGTVALFTLPLGIISVICVVFLFFSLIFNLVKFTYDKLIKISVIGLDSNYSFNFNWFFFDTKAILFLAIILYILVIVSIMIGRSMTKEKKLFSFTFIYFIIIYGIMAPFWALISLYNAIRSKESSWTIEHQRRAQKN